MRLKNLSMISAITSNHAIGNKNELLFHIPEDLKRFKDLTVGSTVIMGKNTWLSLPKRPLPNRDNIVLSCTIDPDTVEGQVFPSWFRCIHYIQDNPTKEFFIIGGGQIYQQTMQYCSNLLITEIDQVVEADTFFPEIGEEWKSDHTSVWHEHEGVRYRFHKYVLKEG